MAEAQLRAWKPGLVDRAKHKLTKWFGDDRDASYMADKVMGVAEYAPVIGDALGAAEAKDAYDQGSYGTAGLYGAAAAVGMLPVLGDAASQGIKKGIKAYHGSPHHFDKFDMSKMGTGEGNQVYSPGIYTAEKEGIAKWYRDSLESRGDIDLAGTPEGISEKATAFLRHAGLTAHRIGGLSDKEAATTMTKVISDLQKTFPGVSDGAAAEAISAIEKGARPVPKKGAMYELNIDASPNSFIEWDNRLTDQSPEVQDALGTFARKEADISVNARHEILSGLRPLSDGRFASGKTGFKKYTPEQVEALKKNLDPEAMTKDFKGQELVTRALNRLGAVRQGDKGPELREFMRDKGISGVKYKDAASRGLDAGEVSRNYVVYDDKLLTILRKYGVVPAGMSAAMLNEYVKENPKYGDELDKFIQKENML